MGEDTFTEVTSQSWFSRLGNAFKGIVIGIILIVISFPLLFWNEGRAVKRYKTLKEGGGIVVSISADAVDAANQGKLVHLTGKAITEETLNDSTFGVAVNAIKLKRTVEMFQWSQESKSEQKKKLGGGTETVTTYSYHKKWSSELINSGGFKKPEGHQNPSELPYQSTVSIAQKVAVGDFMLSPSLVRNINTYTSVSVNIDTVPATIKEKAKIVSGTNALYFGDDPASPGIGDIRVSFAEVIPTDVSLVAKQVNNTFEPYKTETGGSIELLQTGIHNAESMFQQAQRSNTIITWVLRAVGFFLMFIGFRMVFAPLPVFADVLPVLGNIVSVGTGLIAGLVAGIFSFLTVAVAWFVYRPMLSIILIIISGGIAFVIFTRLRKTPPVAAEAAKPPPPPPPGT